MIDSLLLVVPGIIWGASFLFIAEGLDAVAPGGVTFVRRAAGAPARAWRRADPHGPTRYSRDAGGALVAATAGGAGDARSWRHRPRLRADGDRRRPNGRHCSINHELLHSVVSLALGVGLRHEHVSWISIAGGAVCLAGAWMIRRARAADERARA